MINDSQALIAYQKTSRSSDLIVFKNENRLDSVNILKFNFNAKIDEKGHYMGTCIPKEVQLTIRQQEMTFAIGDTLTFKHAITTDSTPQGVMVDLGKFTIEEVEIKEKEGTIELVLYDQLRLLQQKKVGPTYPTNVEALLSAMCFVSNVVLDNDNKHQLQFKTFAIENEIHFEQDPTASDVVRAIAQMHCGYVSMRNNRLFIERPRKTNFTINNQNVYTIDIGNKRKPINSVVISRQPQNDDVFHRNDALIQQHGLNELKIINNPILDLNREVFAQQLLNTVQGETYTQATITMQANPLIEVGDLVSFYDLKNVKHTMLVTEHDLTISQSTLKCTIPETTETNYKRAKSIEKTIWETELFVDKVEKRIVSRIQEVNQELETVKGVVQTISPEAIETKITAYVDSQKDNIKGAVISNVEPQNKTVLWYDTVIQKFKIYENDEWKIIQNYEAVQELQDQKIEALSGELASKEEVELLKEAVLNGSNALDAYRMIIDGRHNELKEKNETLEVLVGNLTTTITQDSEGLTIQKEGSNMSVRLGHNKLSFLDNGVEVAYVSNQKLFITSGVFVHSITVAKHSFTYIPNVQGSVLIYNGEGGFN